VLYARQWTDHAEDAVQEAFLGFCRLRRLQTLPNDEVAWLFTATRNRAINVHLSEKRRTQRENATVVPNWFEADEDNRLDGETVREKLQELPQELREMVVLRIWGEQTFEQIAEEMQTSIATAYRRYKEAIVMLRAGLKFDE
jgi:RNA polymerase sigma-70 factor (ECF subfamily)